MVIKRVIGGKCLLLWFSFFGWRYSFRRGGGLKMRNMKEPSLLIKGQYIRRKSQVSYIDVLFLIQIHKHFRDQTRLLGFMLISLWTGHTIDGFWDELKLNVYVVVCYLGFQKVILGLVTVVNAWVWLTIRRFFFITMERKTLLIHQSWFSLMFKGTFLSSLVVNFMNGIDELVS